MFFGRKEKEKEIELREVSNEEAKEIFYKYVVEKNDYVFLAPAHDEIEKQGITMSNQQLAGVATKLCNEGKIYKSTFKNGKVAFTSSPEKIVNQQRMIFDYEKNNTLSSDEAKLSIDVKEKIEINANINVNINIHHD